MEVAKGLNILTECWLLHKMPMNPLEINAPKLSNSDQQSESFCSTSQFLTHGASVDSFVIAKASATQKEDRQLLHKLAYALHC